MRPAIAGAGIYDKDFVIDPQDPASKIEATGVTYLEKMRGEPIAIGLDQRGVGAKPGYGPPSERHLQGRMDFRLAYDDRAHEFTPRGSEPAGVTAGSTTCAERI